MWGSPYYRNPETDTKDALITPQQYGEFWSQVFASAPCFDLIAPQDGVGASNNSVANYKYVKEYLIALIEASRTNGRQIWSNAEAFEFVIWNQGTNCKTIQSAPFNPRFETQMALEHNLSVDALISWEYHAYMSPYAGPCDAHKSTLAHYFYRNYSAYIYEPAT